MAKLQPPVPSNVNFATKLQSVTQPNSDPGTVDLDTRIALIFKGKTFGNAPPFLQMDSSDSETDQGKPEVFSDVNSDSNNSENKKRSCEKNNKVLHQPNEASDISSDEELIGKKDKSKLSLICEKEVNDDNMSLSSLSSQEDPIQTKEGAEYKSIMSSYMYSHSNQNPFYYHASGYGNIDKQFLASMLDKCGTSDEINIYHHPITNKHLGIARIVFDSTKGARQFVEKYNQKSVMGKV